MAVRSAGRQRIWTALFGEAALGDLSQNDIGALAGRGSARLSVGN